MGYWLTQKRGGQEAGVLKRFSPPFWTVNFPRPMMASVVTLEDDGLRVDTTFYGSGDLCGLIWESEDRWDHPLTAYETSRDYSGCTLSFRWRSEGMKPLDAIHGPTLTIEGRDASGAAHSWYVRLWNYAEGGPEDARITLDFDDLMGGYTLPEEADPVYPADIDRLFISLVPADYDAGSAMFPHGMECRAELTELRCEGWGSVLTVGDVMVPEHGFSIATGYDDAYNLTPERVIREAHALGYRGDINHYVGMSHYFRLEPASGALYVSLAGGALNAPCRRWHEDFAERAKDMGFGLILSLSYELFDAHCWNDWKQRGADGAPALTGWEPPSALLSPAHGGAMGYLHAVARAFVAIARDTGLPVRFQIGEPWWWVRADGHLCIYDDAARAAFGGDPLLITDVRDPLDDAQKALLDAAGAMLAGSTAALCDAVRVEAPGAETLLLAFLPTILDPQAPELKRVNLPTGWAAPAFDRLQIEDYDWVTAGRTAREAQGRVAILARLGYPLPETHYFAGFVNAGLTADTVATQWALIVEAAEAAKARGHAATYIWALPQVSRDGLTLFSLDEEDDVQSFDDIAFPLDIGRRAQVTPAFSTRIIEAVSGHEQRTTDWADARMRFDAGPGVRSEADVASLIAFFRARRGAARGFRFTDPYDHGSGPHGSLPAPTDQPIGTGDGNETRFALAKFYGEGADAQRRLITRPQAGSARVAVDGVELAGGWAIDPPGIVTFEEPPALGAIITAGFLFDVPVRFEEDSLTIDRETFLAGSVPSVPLVEIRE
jgi:uncharacterized protein (TIGR02217 family)